MCVCVLKKHKKPKGSFSVSFCVSCHIININCDDSCQIILQKSDIVFNNGPCVAIYVLQTELSDYLEIKIDK